MSRILRHREIEVAQSKQIPHIADEVVVRGKQIRPPDGAQQHEERSGMQVEPASEYRRRELVRNPAMQRTVTVGQRVRTAE